MVMDYDVCTCDPHFEKCRSCSYVESMERLAELEKRSHITEYYTGKDQGAYGHRRLSKE